MTIKEIKQLIIEEQDINIPSKDLCIHFKFADNLGFYALGVRHSNNPSEAHYTRIEKDFKNFITDNNNPVLALENIVPDKLNSREEMITKYKETGLLAWIGWKSNIELICIEPREKVMEPVIEKFDKTDIALWMFLDVLKAYPNSQLPPAKLISVWIKLFGYIDTTLQNNYLGGQLPDKTIVDFVNRKYLRPFQQRLKNIGVDAPGNLELLTRNHFDKNILKKATAPTRQGTVINLIALEINKAHDILMAEKIIGLLDDKKSVFTVLGINHVIAQRPVFDEYQRRHQI